MSKPYLNYQQQIDKLVNEKGLIISDTEYAREMLTNIGYFSLIGGYKSLFINPMTRRYEIPTTFEDIVALYQFDEALRQLTFGYLIKVEQKIRQLISDSFCVTYGENQTYYLTASSYSQDPRKAGDLSKLLRILFYNANANIDKQYLVHQRNTYGNVPLWVITKILTFGQLSKFYSLLQSREQSAISKAYEHVTERNLGKYLNDLTLFRNVCAHNERLFSFKLKAVEFPDTPIHKKMNLPRKGTQYLVGKKDYFGLVIALRYLLPKTDFFKYKKELMRLINAYCRKSKRLAKQDLLDQMGMPANWEMITRYRL